MTETEKGNKKLIIGVIVMALLIALFAVLFFLLRPKAVQGAKTITIEVVDDNAASTLYTTHTDAEYLRQAMEETDGLEFSGTEGEFGLMVETVNGVTADYNADQSYWGFYVNGEYCNSGIDTQPVTDGDAFRIVYTR